MKKIFILIFATLISCNLYAAQVETQVTGYGACIDEAVLNALSQASSQINGIRLNSKIELKKDLLKVNKEKLQVSDLSKEIKLASKGAINNYKVLETNCESDRCEAKVSVSIEKFVMKNQAVLNQKTKIAVLPFSGNKVFTKRVQKALTDQIVQSRKFVTLDRSNLSLYKNEYNLWKGDQVSNKEKVKLGQGFGLDFMIIGDIETVYAKTYTKVIGASDLTGEKGTIVKYGKTYAKIRVQLVDLATKEIKYSDYFTVFLNENNAQKAANIISKKIADKIIQNIYPMTIISVQGDTVILNQGGNGVTKGNLYDVFSLGDRLIDPYSGEFLGQIESNIGTIKITEVLPKISKGQIIKGDPKLIKVAYIVRMHIRPKTSLKPLIGKKIIKKVQPIKTKTVTPEVGGVIF